MCRQTSPKSCVAAATYNYATCRPTSCRQRETLPIAGFALKENKFDGLYIGRLKGKDLLYAGKIDHGFDKGIAKDLQARLRPLIRKEQPYAKKTGASGSSRHCWPRSSTGPSPPRARSGIPCSRAYVRIYDPTLYRRRC
jgi:hypothetical protein